MMNDFERYAIYWVPAQPDTLCKFGCSWMGWCAELGEPRKRRGIVGLTDDIAAATRRVWRHGLHARIAGPGPAVSRDRKSHDSAGKASPLIHQDHFTEAC